jgi:hypothetical protein
MVQYRLNETGAPEVATYAQHNDEEAEACPWANVQTVSVADPVIGTRQAPIVYVAARSQASYFIPGVHIRPNRPDDAANGDGEEHTPAHEMISDGFPSWGPLAGALGRGRFPRQPGKPGQTLVDPEPIPCRCRHLRKPRRDPTIRACRHHAVHS